jgi:hypothetical protein
MPRLSYCASRRLRFAGACIQLTNPTIVLSALVAVLTPPASYWFALEELQVLRCQFSASQHLMIRVSTFIAHLTARHAAASIQPMQPPSCHHQRIGRLVSMHGLSALALNGRKELMFGPEQNGPVPVWLVEVSAEVGASLG